MILFIWCVCVCVQTRSDVTEPLNLGSDEKVTMNEMMALALSFRDDDQATCSVKHIPGPQGVRGRNSDNTLIKELLGSLFYFSFLSYN